MVLDNASGESAGVNVIFSGPAAFPQIGDAGFPFSIAAHWSCSLGCGSLPGRGNARAVNATGSKWKIGWHRKFLGLEVSKVLVIQTLWSSYLN